MFGKPAKVIESRDQASNKASLTKEVALAQKDIDIARGREMLLADILEYGLLKENPLFEGDFPKKPDKSVLVTELEKNLIDIEYSFSRTSELDTVLIVVMSIIRRITISSIDTFGNLLHTLWNSIKSTCAFKQLDVIYDSYIESSLKERERQRRVAFDIIEYLDIDLSTPLPVQMDKFWGSSRNKEKKINS